jgi:hypothetical protein
MIIAAILQLISHLDNPLMERNVGTRVSD